ncbi:hypothetical protein V5E97_36495 [Singulisphaera sp. Ch08]|uniref:Uncharacterized protein n=1 Tax=Singulisphaera sp. Ch08 TaxID=3120278 RepID=A0AAU7CES7_9BACT
MIKMTTRRLMVVVAFAALTLWWLVTRPYPMEFEVIGVCIVSWSDGTTSVVYGPQGIRFRGTSWFQIVDWPNGTTSFYLVLR